MRLARTLGTANFGASPGHVLLGWSADGASLYLTYRSLPTFRVWRMGAQSGVLLSETEFAAMRVSGVAPAGPARVIVDSMELTEGRYALWDLDRAALVGPVRAREATTTTLALSGETFGGPPWQEHTIDLSRRAEEELGDDELPGAVSPDGTMFLRAVPNGKAPRVGVYDARGERLWTLKATQDDPVRFAAFTRDRGVVVAFLRGGLGCWDVDRRAWRWRDPAHRGGVVALVRSVDGETFYSYAEDGCLRATSVDGKTRWETFLRRGRAKPRRWDHNPIRVVSSPDGSLVAVSLLGSVRVIDAATGADRGVIDGHAGAVTCLAFSRDGSLFASGGADGDVRVYDAPSGDERWVLETDGAQVTDVAFRADRASVLVHEWSGVGSEWSLHTGLEVSRVKEGEWPDDMAATTDGDRVLVRCDTRRRLWTDRSPERTVWSYETPKRGEEAGRYWWRQRGGRDGFSADGARALLVVPVVDNTSSDEFRLVTLDVESGRSLGSPRTLPGVVFDVVEGDEQTHLVAAAYGTITVLDERGERTAWTVPAPATTCRASMSRDGRVLASQDVERVDVWRLGDPSRRIGSFAREPDEAFSALALSPDGRTLVVGTALGRVLIFTIDVDPAA